MGGFGGAPSRRVQEARGDPKRVPRALREGPSERRRVCARVRLLLQASVRNFGPFFGPFWEPLSRPGA
eukprot:7440988-Pyramimonas_sp.AAC.1